MTATTSGRRDVLKKGAVAAGAVWVAPVLLSTSAGAQNGSCVGCGDPMSIPFPTGWTHSVAGTWQGAGTGSIGYLASPPADYLPYISGGVHFVERDPSSITSEAYYTIDLDLLCGATYTFDFDFVWRDHTTHNRTQTLRAEIKHVDDAVWTSQAAVTTIQNGTNNFTTGSGSLSYAVAVSGTHQFRFRHTFNGTQPTGNIVANDIAVNAPTVSCAPTP